MIKFEFLMLSSACLQLQLHTFSLLFRYVGHLKKEKKRRDTQRNTNKEYSKKESENE